MVGGNVRVGIGITIGARQCGRGLELRIRVGFEVTVMVCGMTWIKLNDC